MYNLKSKYKQVALFELYKLNCGVSFFLSFHPTIAFDEQLVDFFPGQILIPLRREPLRSFRRNNYNNRKEESVLEVLETTTNVYYPIYESDFAKYVKASALFVENI